jgi:hypothetical protein
MNNLNVLVGHGQGIAGHVVDGRWKSSRRGKKKVSQPKNYDKNP